MIYQSAPFSIKLTLTTSDPNYKGTPLGPIRRLISLISLIPFFTLLLQQGRSQEFILTEARGLMASAGARAYNGGLGAEPPAGSRGRAPGQGVRGRSPPEAERL